MYIREGSKEKELIKQIQKIVKVKVDGDYGPATKKAVLQWQRDHYLVADGVVGPKTFEAMHLLDTDLSNTVYQTDNGLLINRHYLPKGEYIEGPFKNEYVFLHHTAGWDNPYNVIDAWGRDTRGRVATEFVIGGQSVEGNRTKYDGEVVQAFPEGCQGWHLGPTGSAHMSSHSVAIELCSFGFLKDNKTYVGIPAAESQITILAQAFRGFTHWHKYSDAQLKATELLLEFIAKRDNINLREGLPHWIRAWGPARAFEFQQEAYDGKIKGLLTHTNVNKEKVDNFPQQELVDMLLSL